jgi:hypothetical protein
MMSTKVKIFLSISALASLMLAGYIVYKAQWQEFSSLEGRFVVLRPSNYTLRDKVQINTDAGQITVHSFLAIDKKVVYVVSYCDYPESFVQRVEPDNIFNSGCEVGMDVVKGNFISKKIISFNGYPGREVRYYPPSQLPCKSRIYLVKNRLYQVTISTHKQREKVLDEEPVKFLDSFRLIEDK